MSSNKIKNILKPSSIKILILLSIIIILILIYLKINNKELFATVADVDNYFKNYFATLSLYEDIQNTLATKGQIINELENDIQTVLSGKILTPKITTESILNTETIQPKPTPTSNIKTIYANDGSVNCNTYCRGKDGASWNNELPSDWRGAKCVGTNDTQNGCNSQVLGIRTANNPLTCECQRDDAMTYNKLANVKTVYGNNGWVNCNTYCAGTGGSSWNNELPPEWKGAICLATNDPIGCGNTNVGPKTGLTCDCQKNDSTPWKN